MAATVSAPAPLGPAVAPLRAGQGYSFWLRRLHSLSGIVPVGAFLLEHILVSNATAIGGPAAYARQVRFLASLPLVPVLEIFGIWLPILFHALYGFYIWYRGEINVGDYPWTGNWMYTLQRWTGGIAFLYIIWHTYTMRFSGIDLHEYPGSFVRQSAERGFADRFLPLLCGGADRCFLALCVWDLVVLCEVGDCFRRKGSQEISGGVPGVFLCTERGWLGALTKLRSTPQQATDPTGAHQIEAGPSTTE